VPRLLLAFVGIMLAVLPANVRTAETTRLTQVGPLMVEVPAEWLAVPQDKTVPTDLGGYLAVETAIRSPDPTAYASITLAVAGSLMTGGARTTIPLTESGLQKEAQRFKWPLGASVRVISLSFARLDGYNAVRVDCEGSFAFLSGRVHAWVYVMPVGDRTAYLMFGAAPNRFAEFEPTFSRVVSSVRWADSPPLLRVFSGTVLEPATRYLVLSVGLIVVWMAVTIGRRRGAAAKLSVATEAPLTKGEAIAATDPSAPLPLWRLEELLTTPEELRPGAESLIRSELARRRTAGESDTTE
jgi:hypothetical protein